MLDSLSFYTFKVGVMYLGLTPFPISTRNSAVAVAHLVSKTGVKQMFVSSDPAMQRLAQEANEHLAKDGLEFEVLPMPLFEDIYGLLTREDEANTKLKPKELKAADWKEAMIVSTKH